MLGRDFVSWAGHRLWSAGALVGAGAAVEGISILFLIPLLGIILNGQGSSETTVHVLNFLPQATTPTLGPALVGFAVLLCLRFWILYVRDTTLARLEQDYVVALRLRLFNRLASASWATAADLGRGQIGHALSRDIDRASVSVGAVLRGGAASVMLAVQVSLALWLAPLVALAAFALGAGVFALLAPLRRRAHRLGHDITQDDFRLFSTVQVFLRGLKPAKAHGLETQYLRVLEDAASAFGQRMLQMRRDILLGSLSMQAAMGILALGAVYIAHGWLDASPEVLIVLLLLMARLGAPLQQLQLAAQALRLGDAAYQAAIGSVADGETSKRPTRSDSLHAAPVIELRSVTVIGDANSVVLSNITATIPAGEATAITGASGSGKTTLCDVLAGLVQPTKGHVFVDGTELHPALLDSLSVSLAYVGQDDAILEDTLRAHLTFGANSPSDDAIWAALDVTGAAEAVRNVAEGLDAKLRFDAARFSGGERQRLRLSRALLRRPKLLILDEATSALDLSSERAVLNNVFAALGEATVVMVTHRPETAALATHQLYLNAGVLKTV